MFLFQKIEEVMMTNHDARHAVGEFVMQQKENLYQYTISDIAEYTYTSKATVVRFAKTLGFDGWKEFMKAFIAEMNYQKAHQGDVDVNYPFKESDDTKTIIDKIKTVQIESLQDSADLLDIRVVEKATEYLLNAQHIVIFGAFPNVFLGELFRRKLITIGKQVDIARPGESGIISHTLKENDCAIMISYSGNNESVEPLLHIKNLLHNHVPIIGITGGGDNYIRKHSDCVLTISSKERLYTKISNYATEESISFILNVLFSCLYAKDYQKNGLFKIRNAKNLEQERNAVLKDMQDEML